MNLSQALRLSTAPCLALVGAGGKTTALFQLAHELSHPIILTASTHMHVDQIKLADSHWLGETPEDIANLEHNLCGTILVTGPIDGDRTKGLNICLLRWLRALCIKHSIPLIIEADGARSKPLKAPGENEPPIPDFVDMVVVVAGLSALGKPLNAKWVHRVEQFQRISQSTSQQDITSEMIEKALIHPDGGLKNIPPTARCVALLNQADKPELQAQGKAIAERLLSIYQSIVIASLQQSQIHAVYEQAAGIVLSAGEARRFGQPKQLLNYHGQPFVRVVALAALAAGLSPVLVVTGANAEKVEAAIRDIPIKIVRNYAWKNGQSSSIQSGIHSLPPPALPSLGISQYTSPPFIGIGGGQRTVGSVIFLLGDQPQVKPTILRALVEHHTINLAPVIVPLVASQRANPVLFDCTTFPDLMALTGDVGGRAIFSKFPISFLPWYDDNLLLDIDTPDDLMRLKNNGV